MQGRMRVELDVKELKWHLRFLVQCLVLATWSKDRSTKVGALVVDDRRRILATGYNGFPTGVNDNPDYRHERPIKYKFTEHAERNCIYAAANHGVALDRCTMYCLRPTCSDCARAVIQAGLKRVVYFDDPIKGWDEDSQVTEKLFLEAWTDVIVVPPLDEHAVEVFMVHAGYLVTSTLEREIRRSNGC